MPLSMHDASIPVFLHGLGQLTHILDKAAAHATQQGIDPDTLASARLADDMLPLSGQVQRASDTSKLSAERLSGIASPKMPDVETTLDDLKARVDATASYLRTIGPEHVDGSEEKAVAFKAGPWRLAFSGRDYLTQFALPNFQFHVVTAYAILRHRGVPLGKLDFLGRIGSPSQDG